MPLTASRNNLGFLRLLFASLVLVSHAPELVDGNRSREILTRIFGTLSFGEVAVDGFFLISGYLITQSFDRDPEWRRFLLKRLLRILPGFFVASALCLAIGPLVGGRLREVSLRTYLLDFVFLGPPTVPGAFAGNAYQSVNGALWTIAYEFRCYLLVLMLGMIGALRHRAAIAVAASLGLALNCFHPAFGEKLPNIVFRVIGEPEKDLRLIPIFMVGMLFYLFRQRITFDGRRAAFAACALAALMFVPAVAEAAFAVVGGYLIFCFGFQVRSPTLASVGVQQDFSYGVYLYGWPMQ